VAIAAASDGGGGGARPGRRRWRAGGGLPRLFFTRRGALLGSCGKAALRRRQGGRGQAVAPVGEDVVAGVSSHAEGGGAVRHWRGDAAGPAR
jgi:hypothetical protein